MIPSPPTDNLYKFVAFCGLAIALLSGWALFKDSSLATEIRRDYMVLAADMSDLLLDAEELNVALPPDLIARLRQPRLQTLYSFRPITSTIETYRADLDQFDRILADSPSDPGRAKLRLALRAFKKTCNDVVLKNELPSSIDWRIGLGLSLGAFAMAAGFKGWYQFVQQHQDVILKSEAAQAAHDLQVLVEADVTRIRNKTPR